jgi:hypothetical protein
MTDPAPPSPPGNPPSTLREKPEQRIPRPDAAQRELALVFCNECLYWPDAAVVTDHRAFHVVENRRRPELSHLYGKQRGFQFNPHDLGDVVNAMTQWCDTHAVGLFLEYSPGASPKDTWHARLAPHAEMRGGDPCGVLMLACLAAERSVRARNPGAVQAGVQGHNPAAARTVRRNVEQQATALAFCKECLGWKEARIFVDCGYAYVTESVPKHLSTKAIYPWERHFHFDENHLHGVMERIRPWCDGARARLALEYFPSGSAKDCWRASFESHAQAYSDGACAALLAASLAAHRKITLLESSPCPSLLP